MARPKKTEAQLQAAREQILETAYAILQEEGPQSLTSRAIAKRLGVAHMSLFYSYFENQAAIISALRERELAKLRQQQQAIVQRAEHEEIAVLVREILEIPVRYARETPNLYYLAWIMPEVGGESPEENRQRMLGTVTQLARLIQIGIEQGKFAVRDASLAAATVLGMVNMPFIFFQSGRILDPAMRDRMVDEVLSAAIGYLIHGVD